MIKYPQRIVCLTEETTETLYLLGQGDRVVGVSGYTVRPPEARLKPKVSAFINAKFDKIEALRPDLVLAFSDLQADLVAELARRGMKVKTALFRRRRGWGRVSALREDRLYEIKSTYILQPGPASLTDGVRRIHSILRTALGQPSE